tara:strand:+ start:769 stop:903 length:135 start_codon:yes stop_codon:yes gene_type:complete
MKIIEKSKNKNCRKPYTKIEERQKGFGKRDIHTYNIHTLLEVHV